MAKQNFVPIVVHGAKRPEVPDKCMIVKNFDPDFQVKWRKPWLPWKRREFEKIEKMIHEMPGWHDCALWLYLSEVHWAAVGVFYID